MSVTPTDPEARAYIDEFQQRLAQSGRFYRDALQALYEDRVMRDLERLHQPPHPRQPLIRRAAHASLRAGGWIVRRFSSRRDKRQGPDDPEVIEGSYVVLSEENEPVSAANANPTNEPIIHVYKENKEHQR